MSSEDAAHHGDRMADSLADAIHVNNVKASSRKFLVAQLCLCYLLDFGPSPSPSFLIKFPQAKPVSIYMGSHSRPQITNSLQSRCVRFSKLIPSSTLLKRRLHCFSIDIGLLNVKPCCPNELAGGRVIYIEKMFSHRGRPHVMLGFLGLSPIRHREY
ncbi:hypothetical protein B0H10DRAFT_1942989 [Mycena sp. CBHHK59/15]|nr:hypothetical protein B0H10DRAFT_1942989 [Mycena sp. CBHHK59/15]